MIEDTFFLEARNALAGATKPPTLGRPANMEEARQVAQDFEAFFLSQALKPMFAGIEAEEPFGGGPAEDIWRSLQIDEYGKAIARTGGIGIADAVLAQMLRTQEID